MRLAHVTLIAVLAMPLPFASQCDSIRGGSDTPCPKPTPNAYYAGEGSVVNKQHRQPSEGCAEKWFLQVQQFQPSGEIVWFETSEGLYAACDRGEVWKPRIFGSRCEG